MKCLFCNKELSGSHNSCQLCPEKYKALQEFNSFLKKYADYIVQLHIDPVNGLSANGILEELLKKDIIEELPENTRIFLEEGLKANSNSCYGATAVRNLLKQRGVILKSTPSRIKNVIKTTKERYGVENYGQLQESREKLRKRNNAKVFKFEFSTSFEEYRKKVNNITSNNKKRMPKPKIDYYTNLPFLKETSDPFLMQGDLYPTIDHKLSVFYCYVNNISAEECGSISNLCWTYRFINSKKMFLTESMFKNTILPFLKDNIAIEIENLIKKGYHPL